MAFNPTATYRTVTDIDGNFFAYQGNTYYDRYGTSFSVLPASARDVVDGKILRGPASNAKPAGVVEGATATLLMPPNFLRAVADSAVGTLQAPAPVPVELLGRLKRAASTAYMHGHTSGCDLPGTPEVPGS